MRQRDNEEVKKSANEEMSDSLITDSLIIDLLITDPLSALKKAVEEGIDISLLYERLSWSPTERIERHQRALEFAETLREAGKRKHDGRRKAS